MMLGKHRLGGLLQSECRRFCTCVCVPQRRRPLGSTCEDVRGDAVYPGGELKATEYTALAEWTVIAHQGNHLAVRCN